MPGNAPFLLAVQKLLFEEWNPIGVRDNPLCSNEYGSYAPTICRFLREGADEYKIAAHLTQLQRVNMGISSIKLREKPSYRSASSRTKTLLHLFMRNGLRLSQAVK